MLYIIIIIGCVVIFRLDGECNIKLSNIEPHPISTRSFDYQWMAIESLREGSNSHKSTVVRMNLSIS